jgi:hypothetical protein
VREREIKRNGNKKICEEFGNVDDDNSDYQANMMASRCKFFLTTSNYDRSEKSINDKKK